MESLNRQLKKGVLDIIILRFLQKQKMYGYEIMTELESRAGGFFTMKEGTLYPILYRLEDAGYIQSEWEKETEKRGVPRKYYVLTPSGQNYLANAKISLQEFSAAVNRIMEE